MSLAFKTTRVNFPTASGGTQTRAGSVSFNHRVKTADASVKGYSIGFDGDDHHFYQETIEVKSVAVVGNDVQFNVDFALRDKSGHFDDEFQGEVIVLVTADLEERSDDGGDN